MRVGSLFSGIGGLELGLERAGMEVAWQVENDPYCLKVLEKHWPHVRRHTDIKTFLADTEHLGRQSLGADDESRVVDGPEEKARGKGCEQASVTGAGGERMQWLVDLICGGFPCQPVSVAGKQRGDTDERWLWDEMRRVCEVVRPRWVLAENVPGLLSASSGRLFGTVVRDLAEIGYVGEWFCLSAANVGANHVRDRVLVLGRLADTKGQSQRSRLCEGEQAGQWGRRPGDGCGEVADAECERGCGGHINGQHAEDAGQPSGRSRAGWWDVEPDVGRVAHGVPKRVDRLRRLGNAVVPQVAEYIGRMIMEHEHDISTEPSTTH